MKIKRMLAVMVSVLMVISLLAACGSSGGDSQNQAETSKQSETEAATSGSKGDATEGESESETEEAVESVIRDVINVGIEADVTDWSPWASGSSGRNDALYSIYQPLVDYNAVEGTFTNVLAKSFEQSDDNMEYIFELWDNIVDSEGNPLTSSDVKASYLHASESALTEYQDVVINIIDDYNFTMSFLDDDLVTPREIEVGELKRICTPIVTEAAFDASGDGLKSVPVGTGPYKFDSQTSGYMFTLVKNDNYWQTDEQRLQPNDAQNVNTINFYVISEPQQRTTALQNGTIDICGYISSDDIDKFDGNGFYAYEYPHNLSMIMWANADDSSPCNDVNLRKAIYYAVDSNAILASVYNGSGKVMYDQCPEWNIGYNSDWESEDNYYTSASIDTAKEYLAKSDYNNETLKIICNTNSPCVNTAQLVLNFLEQIGVKAEVTPYESSVYSEYIQDPKNWDIMVNTRPASGGYISAGWVSDMASYRQTFGGTINFIFDDTFQEMLNEVCTLDGFTQDNIDELHEYMIENAFSKGLVNYNSTIIVPDYITDVVLSLRKTILPGGCTYTE